MSQNNVCVLFVCMGNICRSPAGEAILKHLILQDQSISMQIESCGIGDWHLGESPDVRIQEASKARGVVLTGKAQQFKDHYLDRFDYILAADKEILRALYHYAKLPEHKAKIQLITHYSMLYEGQDIPDPYYQPEGAFELVLDMLEESCQGFLKHIRGSF